ncbi:hypothetical protein [Primorskyibacter sp. 2E107]|uniref:hypothetical protein n=1 Tax=Primorskyibacter sp. 2E107 TaxID=3403458 RepID=UPI003AF614CF
MAKSNVLNPHPPEFDRFLYAFVGEDRNGYAVTVLSTLARLGLDPWKETAELVTLGHDAARARLANLLARSRDVPALASDHGRIARNLSQLLPEGRTPGRAKQAASSEADSHLGTSGAIWAVLAIIFVLFQFLLVGGSGSGE